MNIYIFTYNNGAICNQIDCDRTCDSNVVWTIEQEEFERLFKSPKHDYKGFINVDYLYCGGTKISNSTNG